MKIGSIILLSAIVLVISGCTQIVESERMQSNLFSKSPVEVNGVTLSIGDETISTSEIESQDYAFKSVYTTLTVSNENDFDVMYTMGSWLVEDRQGNNYGPPRPNEEHYSTFSKAFPEETLGAHESKDYYLKITIPIDSTLEDEELVLSRIRFK